MSCSKSYRELIFIAIFAGLLCFNARGQVSIGGLVDAELRKGGPDSSPFINQTPTDEWILYTPSIRLFSDFTIDDNLFLQTTLQTDYYANDSYNPVFISTLTLNYLPFDHSNFMVTAGRFVSPYGLYSERLLSPENPFVHLPLSYTYHLPVSRTWGLYDYDSEAIPEADYGSTLLYRRGYSQGLMASNVGSGERTFSYFLAATVSSPAGYNEMGISGFPALIGRVTFQPSAWSRIGFSGSYGSYLKRESGNSILSESELSSYKQFMLGTDVTFSFLYYTIAVAMNWNRWEAPVIDQNNAEVVRNVNTDAAHLLLEGKYRLPFLVGGYVAGRIEKLSPIDISSGYNTTNDFWAPNKTRLEGAAGYQLTTDILVKISYSHPVNERGDWDDDLFVLQVSAGF